MSANNEKKQRKMKKVYRYRERLEEPFRILPGWYRENHRILPWRGTGDPYDVWVSEIMLQQTRVAAARDYFLRFKAELPDVRSLAAVPLDRLLKLWEGLGYYSRPKNMQKAAKMIVSRFDGRIPDNPEVLRSLPGIGSYTAGAIASIAYGVPEPAVDGNVLRVCSRISGNDDDIGLAATKKNLEEAVRGLMKLLCADDIRPEERIDPGDLNQSLMELGAVVCVPNAAPLCGKCPVRGCCTAFRENQLERLPVKAPGKKRRVEKKTILLIQNGDAYLIRRRPDTGLLAGLWEFPSVGGFVSKEEAASAASGLLDDGAVPLYIEALPDAKHIFSHVEWRMKAYRIRVADPDTGASAAARQDRAEPDGEKMRFANARELREVYSLPSAFSAYRDPICGL